MDKNKEKKPSYFQSVREEVREHKSSFTIFAILSIFVIITLIRQFFAGNYESVFLCILTLTLLTVPAAVQVSFKIELPTTLEIIVLLFIFSAQILGEINNFYHIFPMWDTILHTLNGFLAAAIGCSLTSLLNRSEKIAFMMSPLFVAITAFCFSMTIGVLWEFFEYAMDVFFLFDMQKDTIINSVTSVVFDPENSNNPVTIDGINEVIVNGQEWAYGGYIDIGLHDTMMDMIVNFVGAFVFSIIGFFYAKNKGHGGFANRFVPKRKKRKVKS